jgi:cellulase/cellobiase CelA1
VSETPKPRQKKDEYCRALNQFCMNWSGVPARQQLPRLRLFLAGTQMALFGHYLSARVNRCADLSAVRSSTPSSLNPTLQPITAIVGLPAASSAWDSGACTRVAPTSASARSRTISLKIATLAHNRFN